MKVQNINVPEQSFARARGADGYADAPDAQLIFKKTLSSLSGEQRSAKLTELANAIDEQSKRLAGRTDMSEFERYRKLIKSFMDEAVSGGFAFNKENSFASRGRHRFFATVKTVDERLDAMAKEIISEQADNIKILDGIGEIRGLILDMLL